MNKKKKILLIIIVVAILCIGCGIGITMLTSKDEEQTTGDNKKKPNSEETVNKENANNSVPDANNYKENSDGSVANTSNKMAGEHISGELIIQNMNVSVSGPEAELADFSFVIRNNGAQTYSSMEVTIVFEFADGTKLSTPLATPITLSPGQSIEVKDSSMITIVGAVDYQFSYKVA